MDLIDRKAAILAVCERECQELKPCAGECPSIWALESLPSIQPEIVRCKDCKHQEKHFHTDMRRKGGGYYIYGCELAEEYSHVCLDEDFCSKAERRQKCSE